MPAEPGDEPVESNVTTSGAKPEVGDALASASGAPDVVVVVVAGAGPGSIGVQASAKSVMAPNTATSALRTDIWFPPIRPGHSGPPGI